MTRLSAYKASAHAELKSQITQLQFFTKYIETYGLIIIDYLETIQNYLYFTLFPFKQCCGDDDNNVIFNYLYHIFFINNIAWRGRGGDGEGGAVLKSFS